jgi:hypothetical protein
MFIKQNVEWTADCDSKGIDVLPFEQQMKKFVSVKVNSACCSNYGICGEQYVKDIVFSKDNEKIEATRFRFQHTPLRNQTDYIRNLQITRWITGTQQPPFRKLLRQLHRLINPKLRRVSKREPRRKQSSFRILIILRVL